MSPRRRLAAESISQGVSAGPGDGGSLVRWASVCIRNEPTGPLPPSGRWMMITRNSLVMRRLSIALALAALCLPVSAQAATRVSAFYYPWYATSSHDGGYQHWSQLGHAPPNDIAAAFYPARGVYSSADRLVVAEQMDELHVAGVD